MNIAPTLVCWISHPAELMKKATRSLDDTLAAIKRGALDADWLHHSWGMHNRRLCYLDREETDFGKPL